MEIVNVSEAPEYHDSHPLVSLVSACFWVICKSRSLYNRSTLLKRYIQYGLYHGSNP